MAPTAYEKNPRRSAWKIAAAVAALALAGTVLPTTATAAEVRPVPNSSSSSPAARLTTTAVSSVKLAPATSQPSAPVAMWVWKWDSPADLVTFAKTHRVNTLYLYAHPGFTTDPVLSAKIKDTVRAAKAAGLTVWAMGGDPSWVLNPNTAGAWMDEVVSSRLFAGAHLEIEPQQYADWETNKAFYAAAYVTTLNVLNNHAGRTPIDVSLPWWYHTVAYGTSTLTDATIKIADQITIITYADTAAEVNYDAQIPARKATAAKKPFRLASETNNTGNGWVDFYGHTATYMYKVQSQVNTTWASNRYYAGFAVHDYTGWMALAP